MDVKAPFADLIRQIADFPKAGIIFKDITPLLADAKAFDFYCHKFAALSTEAEYVAGIEARGFIFAAAVSAITNKGFIPIRKSGKLPGEIISRSYDLEYASATLELSAGLIPHGKKVLIIDDVLATGGTACAAVDLIIAADLIPVEIAFLLEIPNLGGESLINKRHPGLNTSILLTE